MCFDNDNQMRDGNANLHDDVGNNTAQYNPVHARKLCLCYHWHIVYGVSCFPWRMRQTPWRHIHRQRSAWTTIYFCLYRSQGEWILWHPVLDLLSHHISPGYYRVPRISYGHNTCRSRIQHKFRAYHGQNFARNRWKCTTKTAVSKFNQLFKKILNSTKFYSTWFAGYGDIRKLHAI